MNDTHNNALVLNAKELRKNMTKEERHLWYDFLKNLPVNVNRQKIIGNYIVDFYIPKAQIVIEIDGSQHYEEHAKAKDEARDTCLSKTGILILRYTNQEINSKFKSICIDIQKHIDERTQVYTSSTVKDGPPSPPIKGEGEFNPAYIAVKELGDYTPMEER